MKKFIEAAGIAYSGLCIGLVTTILIGMMLFGGTVHVKINFWESMQLIKSWFKH